MEQRTFSEEVVVDATGRALGRVASEVALLLQGKRTPSYETHTLAGTPSLVRVINLARATIHPRRLTGRRYWRHSGHLGGLRSFTLEQRLAREGRAEVFRSMVRGMLPRNRLRKAMLGRLVIEDGNDKE